MKEVIWYRFNSLHAVSVFMRKYDIPSKLIGLTIDHRYKRWDLLFWDEYNAERNDFAKNLNAKYED